MTASTGDTRAWERLGRALIARRAAIDPAYVSRQAFCDAVRLNYRLIYDIEEARRTNFGTAILSAIEVAYRLSPGSIRAALELYESPDAPARDEDAFERAPETPRRPLLSAVPHRDAPGAPDEQRGLSPGARMVLDQVETAERVWRAAGKEGEPPAKEVFARLDERFFWEQKTMGRDEKLEAIAAMRQFVAEQWSPPPGNSTSGTGLQSGTGASHEVNHLSHVNQSGDLGDKVNSK